MADTGAPRYPVIHVTSDVGINEPGIVEIRDGYTGQTYYADAEESAWCEAIKNRGEK